MRVFLRKWEQLDINTIGKHLFVIGELSGECFSCRRVGIPVKTRHCPDCKTEFNYIAFRRKIDSHSIARFHADFPSATFIDFDDFKKAVGKREARKLLDI